MRMRSFFALLAVISATKAAFQPYGVPFKSPVTVVSGFDASVIFSNLTAPRGIAFDDNDNLLVVERGLGVTAFSPVSSPNVGWERTVVLLNAALTQGIQVDGKRLYVSTGTETLVYPYDPATKSISAPAFSLITGIPGDGELTTHTLEIERDESGKAIAILVGSGPLTNIDLTARIPANGRSQIRRFVLVSFSSYPPTPLAWSSGQVIAYGIRNPAGFTHYTDPTVGPAASRTLYVVENGASIDEVAGLTPKFVNDNPADELELVTYLTGPSMSLPRSYGFPDCSTLWNPGADPIGVPQYAGFLRGDQFSLNLDPLRDDSWCKSDTNNRAPALSFQAHSVPLDIKFYHAPTVTSPRSFPSVLDGDAFVSFRGSFDRSPPTGYGVVRVPFPLGLSASLLPYSFLIQATNLNSCPGTCIRPVGLAFGRDGRLYVSSDSSGELFVVERSLAIPIPTVTAVPI